jgi:hypothetical protein
MSPLGLARPAPSASHSSPSTFTPASLTGQPVEAFTNWFPETSSCAGAAKMDAAENNKKNTAYIAEIFCAFFIRIPLNGIVYIHILSLLFLLSRRNRPFTGFTGYLIQWIGLLNAAVMVCICAGISR